MRWGLFVAAVAIGCGSSPNAVESSVGGGTESGTGGAESQTVVLASRQCIPDTNMGPWDLLRVNAKTQDGDMCVQILLTSTFHRPLLPNTDVQFPSDEWFVTNARLVDAVSNDCLGLAEDAAAWTATGVAGVVTWSTDPGLMPCELELVDLTLAFDQDAPVTNLAISDASVSVRDVGDPCGFWDTDC